LLRSQDVFVIAESGARFETYKINGYTSYFKGRFKVAKYDRNPRGLMVYIREDDISRRVTEILARMKEILRIGVRDERNSLLEIYVGFICSALSNSHLYNPSFTREIEDEINELSCIWLQNLYK
jgi:hypothetical protein